MSPLPSGAPTRATPRAAPRAVSLAAALRGLLLATALAACSDRPLPTPPAAPVAARSSTAGSDTRPFEVWLVDQSNSPGRAYGGSIRVFDGSDLMGTAAARAV